MTLDLTPLEQAALEEICRTHPDLQQTLEAQLATATVIRRENSGAGFFTYLVADASSPPVKSSKAVLGDVSAAVEGFKQPLIFLLFMENGYLHMLEAATIGESTAGLDPAALRFETESD